MKFPITHGGDPSGIRRRLGLGSAPLLDFSASLNPFGPPPAAIEAAREALGRADRYPEPGAPRLTERLAEYHGVPVDRVIVGAGVTELIGLIGQSLREVLAFHAQALGDPSKPLSHLIDPTYGEYRRISALNEMRAQVWGEHILGWEQDVLPWEAAGIFWTGHPNNPTGRTWNRSTIERFADATLGLLTVVDECFLPLMTDADDRTLIGAAAARDNLLVLRSFTKPYGLPGLRVGYAVGSPDMITRLRQYQDPWTVTAPAEAAALAALEDLDFLERSVEQLAPESTRLVDRLWEIPGLRPAWPDRVRPAGTPPLPNFALVSLTQTDWDSARLQEALAFRGFFVRECSDHPGLEVGSLLTGPDQLVATRGHIRVAVRKPEENDRLLKVLNEVLRSDPNG
ncbi:pyridoxal phosphate-dependent aminotransferase [Tundrisphaera lichenicola]|uniref:pyridoxal phosphate-dependent aminotransferase n=1 Tax=Tundrisphaera lichenicola TaxID=2029860 RepID=UPI003EBE6F4B